MPPYVGSERLDDPHEQNGLNDEEHEGGDFARPSGGNRSERVVHCDHIDYERYESADRAEDGQAGAESPNPSDAGGDGGEEADDPGDDGHGGRRDDALAARMVASKIQNSLALLDRPSYVPAYAATGIISVPVARYRTIKPGLSGKAAGCDLLVRPERTNARQQEGQDGNANCTQSRRSGLPHAGCPIGDEVLKASERRKIAAGAYRRRRVGPSGSILRFSKCFRFVFKTYR